MVKKMKNKNHLKERMKRPKLCTYYAQIINVKRKYIGMVKQIKMWQSDKLQ